MRTFTGCWAVIIYIRYQVFPAFHYYGHAMHVNIEYISHIHTFIFSHELSRDRVNYSLPQGVPDTQQCRNTYTTTTWPHPRNASCVSELPVTPTHSLFIIASLCGE